MLNMKQWKGVTTLVADAVTHGSRAVERVHLATADRTFAILDLVPPIAPVASVVHVVHDGITMASHACVRGVAHIAGAALTGALEWVERDPVEASNPQSAPMIP